MRDRLLAQQLAQAQLDRTLLSASELPSAVEALQLTSHVQEWESAANSQRVGQLLEIVPRISVLNLGAMELHMQRHLAASFRAIHFDPEQAAHEQQQKAAWREWIRHSNLFQFLPHLLSSTPGWGGANRSSAVGPYSVCLDSDPNRPGSIPVSSPEQAKAWQVVTELVNPPAVLQCSQPCRPHGLIAGLTCPRWAMSWAAAVTKCSPRRSWPGQISSWP